MPHQIKVYYNTTVTSCFKKRSCNNNQQLVPSSTYSFELSLDNVRVKRTLQLLGGFCKDGKFKD